MTPSPDYDTETATTREADTLPSDDTPVLDPVEVERAARRIRREHLPPPEPPPSTEPPPSEDGDQDVGSDGEDETVDYQDAKYA